MLRLLLSVSFLLSELGAVIYNTSQLLWRHILRVLHSLRMLMTSFAHLKFGLEVHTALTRRPFFLQVWDALLCRAHQVADIVLQSTHDRELLRGRIFSSHARFVH